MSRIQVGVATFAAALAFVPAAYACEEPDREGEREEIAGQAGDKVEIEVPNTLEGARWELAVEDGDEIADGVDEDAEEEGVTVRFEVPELGEDARQVDLVVDVTHEADDADWSYEVVLAYGGRPAPEPEPEPEPDAQEQEPAPPAEAPREDPPAPQPAPAADPAPQSGSQAAASTPPPAAPAPAAPAVAAAPVQPPAPAGPTSMTPGAPIPAPAGEAAPAPAVVGLGTPAQAAPVPAALPQRAVRSAGRRHVIPRPSDPPPAEPRQPPPPDRPEGGIRLPDIDVPGFGAGLAWTLILVGALTFAGGGLALSGLARHRRRRRIA